MLFSLTPQTRSHCLSKGFGRVFLTFCASPMDELHWLLVAVMAASAAVSSYVTWLVTWCLVVPRRTAAPQSSVVLEDTESEDELPTALPTSPPSTTLNVDSKFYVSSAGKSLHLYPGCPGRNARLKTYRVCINCINRLTGSSSAMPKQTPRGGKGFRHRG